MHSMKSRIPLSVRGVVNSSLYMILLEELVFVVVPLDVMPFFTGRFTLAEVEGVH